MVISVAPPVKSVLWEHFRIQFEQLTSANVLAVPKAAGELDFCWTAVNRP